MFPREIGLKGGRVLSICEAEGSDAEAVLAYVDVICAETDFLTFGPGEFHMTRKGEEGYLEKCRSSENCVYLLARLQERIVGILSFEAGSRPRTQHAGEFGISVLKAYWGMGVASALIDCLVDWAREGGSIQKIDLRVRADNQRAIGLYKAKGFAVEGRLGKQIFVDGVYHDNLWMGREV